MTRPTVAKGKRLEGKQTEDEQTEGKQLVLRRLISSLSEAFPLEMTLLIFVVGAIASREVFNCPQDSLLRR